MKVEFDITGDILIVRLSGEIDHHETAGLREEIDGTYHVFGSRNMILDFSHVTFVDSSGIGVIMGRYNKVSEKGGVLLIAGCSEYLRTILSMSGIFTIVRECESAEAGAELLGVLAAAERKEVDGGKKDDGNV